MLSNNNISFSNLFECKKCGDCCKGYGGTYISKNDIAKIAAFINSEIEEFIKKFCGMSGGRYILGQKEDNFCIFWDKICTIHPVKPKMCREWPFIESVIKVPENWNIMANSCPGINTDISLKEVVKYIISKTLP